MSVELAPITPHAWMDEALCAQVDSEIFFPDKGGAVAPGKRVCAECDVTSECLLFALTNNITVGTWGGLSARERRTLSERAA